MLLYAMMVGAGALWAAILLVVWSACVLAGRADREAERERERGVVVPLRRAV